jgi:hypothetical protein
MMEQTLEQRCKVALECLPDARYRTMLAGLFEELLASAAVLAVQRKDPPRVTVLLPDGDQRDVDVALVDWTATGELQVCITVGDLSAVDRITDDNLHGEAWPDAAARPRIAMDHIYQGNCPDEVRPDAYDPDCPACRAAQGVDMQRHITALLVAHRDMIEAQQRGDSEAEVLAVRRMEVARSAVAGASPCRPRQTDTGEEQLEPFWCHEQSHDRARCETQCAECAEDITPLYTAAGVDLPDGSKT